MSSLPPSPSDKGARAEDAARDFLKKKGYALLDRNHKTRSGEVDLIMRDGETVVFVEVRERRNESYGRGFETVTAAKQAKVATAALAYVKEKKLAGSQFRFDVVSIGPSGLEHIPNAFAPPAGRYTI